jgi:hypothetical protein
MVNDEGLRSYQKRKMLLAKIDAAIDDASRTDQFGQSISFTIAPGLVKKGIQKYIYENWRYQYEN